MPQSWPLSRQQILDASGRPLLVPTVRFFRGGTTEPLTPFSDAALTVPLLTPCPADGTGRFPRIYLADGLYKEEVHGPYGELLWSDDGLGQADSDDGPDDDGGSVADPTAVAVTGDTKWRPDASILPGWVRMNGRTIGSGASGATELASSTAQALYVHLWNTFDQAIAAVVGGRGATALADFSANKPMAVPSMQGCLAGGLDDMGATAAGRIQVLKTTTLAVGSRAASINTATGVAIGMFVTGTGIPVGTTVSDIVGTAVTLSQAPTIGGTRTVRFSAFPDAQEPGQIGGAATQSVVNRNLPATLPAASVAINYPSHDYVAPDKAVNLAFGDAGGVTAVPNILQGLRVVQTAAPAGKTFNITQPNAGGGVPVSTQAPTRLGTYFMKL